MRHYEKSQSLVVLFKTFESVLPSIKPLVPPPPPLLEQVSHQKLQKWDKRSDISSTSLKLRAHYRA